MKGKILVWLISCIVVLSLLGACAAPTAPAESPRITIASGSMGGTTYLRASAISGVFGEFLDTDTTVVMYPTMAQLDGIHEGIIDIAACYPHLMEPAYSGKGDYAADPYSDIRVLFIAAGCPMQIFVPVNSPAQTFRDLIGERYCGGKKGLLGESIFRLVCDALDISSETDFDMIFLGHVESGQLMIGGKLDAYSATSAPPHPAFMEVDLTFPVRLVGFTEEDLAAITKINPTFLVEEIPANFYHMDKPVRTMGPLSCQITSSRLPENTVYELVKNFIEHPEFVGYYHILLKEYIEGGLFKQFVENANPGVPYHIGAYRYFTEIGWKVPEALIPPEAK